MTDLWVYRVDVLVVDSPTDEMPDIAGFDAVTIDGDKIGKVELATTDAERSWIVVDTGFWIFGKKRMIPAGAIDAIDVDERQVRLAISKKDVKEAPDFDEVRRHEAFYQDELEDYYRAHVPA